MRVRFFRSPMESASAAQWMKVLDDNERCREKFAHPLTLLAIGEGSPLEQCDPMFTAWRDSDGQLWELVLIAVERQRKLSLRQVFPDRERDSSHRCRAAVVRK